MGEAVLDRQTSVMLAMAGWAMCVLAGCDLGGAYSKRYSQSLESVGKKAALDAMLCGATTSVTDAAMQSAGANLRLPSLFAEHANSIGATDPAAQPGFLKLPGFSYTIERLVDDPADPQKFAAVHCYLAAVPKASGKADEIQTEIQRQVVAALPGAAWQDEQMGGTAGKLMSVVGAQDFLTADATGARAAARLDGQLDLYFFETGSHYAVVGFRWPKAHGDKYKFFDSTKVSVGTLALGG
jgi:hypothetical protein